jgi:hypothetical protein
MRQRFPKLHGINQCFAVAVLSVQALQVVAADDKRGDPSAVILDVNSCQVAAVA